MRYQVRLPIRISLFSGHQLQKTQTAMKLLALLLMLTSCGLLEGNGETSMDADVPRYLRELFDKYSSGNSSTETVISPATNTIRSLHNIAEVSECGVFNFSLSGIGGHELASKSEFHLYMKQHTFTDKSFFVMVKRYQTQTDGEARLIAATEVAATEKCGWLVFEVGHYLSRLIRDGAQFAVLKVQVDVKISNTTDLDCNNRPITFDRSSSNEVNAPYLTIESYDSHVDRIDYLSALNSLNKTDVEHALNSGRRRRNSPTINLPACRVNNLTIPLSSIPLAEILGGGTILLPGHYNAGICGGLCSNTATGHNQHSQLVHYWIRSVNFQHSSPHEGMATKFIQSCAPSKYTSLSILYKPPSEAYRMIVMQNMIISQCNCLEVAEFSVKTS